MGYALIRACVAIATLVLLTAAGAQGAPEPEASAAIQDCVKTHGPDKGESCIGVVSGPCLQRAETRSTADMIACIVREEKVWDDILNETYRRLRNKLDERQQKKLRDMQRAWIDSREKMCAFYWDFFQGTMASPMSAACMNREGARRALFLLGFLNDTEAK
jgi:uncharacterized protein YecT (DUF1311 family)